MRKLLPSIPCCAMCPFCRHYESIQNGRLTRILACHMTPTPNIFSTEDKKTSFPKWCPLPDEKPQ